MKARAAHHPMGPLELADFIGLDTCLSIMQVLHEGLADLQVSAVSAIGEVCRGRLARPQDPARLLRLSRRQAGPDTVGLVIAGLDPAIHLLHEVHFSKIDGYAGQARVMTNLH